MGGWVDKQKLRSSLTLMTAAGVGDVAELCLTLFYICCSCQLTERILKGSLESDWLFQRPEDMVCNRSSSARSGKAVLDS